MPPFAGFDGEGTLGGEQTRPRAVAHGSISNPWSIPSRAAATLSACEGLKTPPGPRWPRRCRAQPGCGIVPHPDGPRRHRGPGPTPRPVRGPGTAGDGRTHGRIVLDHPGDGRSHARIIDLEPSEHQAELLPIERVLRSVEGRQCRLQRAGPHVLQRTDDREVQATNAVDALEHAQHVRDHGHGPAGGQRHRSRDRGHRPLPDTPRRRVDPQQDVPQGLVRRWTQLHQAGEAPVEGAPVAAKMATTSL